MCSRGSWVPARGLLHPHGPQTCGSGRCGTKLAIYSQKVEEKLSSLPCIYTFPVSFLQNKDVYVKEETT